jgi:hypothetical protein
VPTSSSVVGTAKVAIKPVEQVCVFMMRGNPSQDTHDGTYRVFQRAIESWYPHHTGEGAVVRTISGDHLWVAESADDIDEMMR